MRLDDRCCRWIIKLLIPGFVVTGVLGYVWFSSRFGVCAEARRLLAGRDFEAALVVLDAPPESEPDAETAFLRAVALRRAGRPVEADRELRQATKLNWSSNEVELQRCLLVAQSGRVPMAEPRLMEMMQSGVDDEDAEQICEAMAKGHMIAFRLSEAMTCLEFWLDWQPEAARARLWRAEIYRRGQQEALAIQDYEAILARDPQHYEARYQLARTLLDTGDVVKGHAYLLECNQRQPDDPRALAGLAQSARRLGKLDESLDFAQQALRDNPPTTVRMEALLELGHSQLATGQAAEAVAAFSEVVALDPGIAPAHYSLSRAHALLGNEAAAKQSQQLAQKISGQDTRTYEIQLQLFDEPANADLRCEMASILSDQGKQDEALRWLQSALLVDSNHGPSKQALSRLRSAPPPNQLDSDTFPLSEEPASDDIAP